MSLKRVVAEEWLDWLPPGDVKAVGSRRDLRRMNRLMGNGIIVEGLLRKVARRNKIETIVELGGGDGTFLLRRVRRFTRSQKPIRAILVDRQALVSPETHHGFEQLGCVLDVVASDVFDWLESSAPENCVFLSNLFLHHFEPAELMRLLQRSSLKCKGFVACEPRRSRFALQASRLIGLIGCNAVTRHDGVASVRAGFAGSEISRAWPDDDDCQLNEGEAGLFSHFFLAERLPAD